MSNTPPTTVSAQQPSQGYLETPVSPLPNGGILTSGFAARTNPITGASENHPGIDYAASMGSPVDASQSGTVIFAGYGTPGSGYGGFGNTVAIDNGGGQITQYSHLSSIGVSVGDTVAQSQIIGAVGSTGSSTGSHLHYEVKKNGVPVNPSGVNVGASQYNTGSDKALGSAASAIAQAAYQLNYNQDAILKDIISGKQFRPNEANNYQNLTYHWRFFVTATDDLLANNAIGGTTSIDSFYQKLAKYDQVTLAESGVTAMAIESVSLTSVVGTDFQTSSTSFTNIEMKIVEPNGAVFLDALRNAALQLNVENYEKAFYYMELTFKGYDDDDATSPGSINLAPFSDLPNGGRWLWTVTITDIQVGLTAGGGTYALQMLPLADTMTASDFNIVPAACMIDTSGSLSAFFDNFVHNLNEYWKVMRLGDNQITYEVKYHPVADVMTVDQVKSMPVVPKLAEQNTESVVKFGSNGLTAQIMKGATISQVLDTVMKTCETACNLALDMVPTNVVDTGQNVNAKGYRQSILWRVEPEVHLTGYDPVFNDYKRHFVLHIYGFRNHACVASAQEGLSSDAVQKAIVTELAHRNFMQKKYEYLFTGVNTEVLDLDLNFNLAWSTILPILARASGEQVAPQAKVAAPNASAVSAEAARQAEITAARSKATTGSSNQAITPTTISTSPTVGPQLIATVEPAQTAYNDANAALQTALNDPTVSKEKIQALRTDVAHKKEAVDAAIALTDQYRAARAAAAPQASPSQSYSREYGEDLTNSKSQYRGNAFPITVKSGSPQHDVSGAPSDQQGLKHAYGTILNQANGPLTSQLMTIDLTIMGDPFWLGAGSFEQAISRATDKFSPLVPNFSEGCNVFILRFAYPVGTDDDGNVLLNNNETVTGVYQINRITHHFSDGKFTQVLSAYRIPIVDLFASVYKTAGTSATASASTGNSTTPTNGFTSTPSSTPSVSNTAKTTNTSIPGTGQSLQQTVSTVPTGGQGLIIPSKSASVQGSNHTGPLMPKITNTGTLAQPFDPNNTGF